jgi:hypothetical protein
LQTRILFIPEIVRCKFSKLRRDIGKMTLGSRILGGGELEWPARQFEGCVVCEIMDCSSELELKAFNRCFICCVSKVSIGVERLFDAEGVVLHQMPSFGFFLQTATRAN